MTDQEIRLVLLAQKSCLERLFQELKKHTTRLELLERQLEDMKRLCDDLHVLVAGYPLGYKAGETKPDVASTVEEPRCSPDSYADGVVENPQQ